MIKLTETHFLNGKIRTFKKVNLSTSPMNIKYVDRIMTKDTFIRLQKLPLDKAFSRIGNLLMMNREGNIPLKEPNDVLGYFKNTSLSLKKVNSKENNIYSIRYNYNNVDESEGSIGLCSGTKQNILKEMNKRDFLLKTQEKINDFAYQIFNSRDDHC